MRTEEQNINSVIYRRKYWSEKFPGIKEKECMPDQYKYYFPIDQKKYSLSEYFGECGAGCLCVDKGIDKDIVDSLNRNPNIDVMNLCKGHANHHYGNVSNIDCFYFIVSEKDIEDADRILSSIPASKVDIYGFSPDEMYVRISITGTDQNSRKWWLNIVHSIERLRMNKEK